MKTNSLQNINNKIDQLNREDGPKKAFLQKIEKAHRNFYDSNDKYRPEYYKTYSLQDTYTNAEYLLVI